MKCETCEKLANAVKRMLDRLPYRNDGVERATREVREMITGEGYSDLAVGKLGE